MANPLRALLLSLSFLLLSGCASQDILQAHRGRLFDRTGPLAFFSGGHGFTGPVLGPGTHFTGLYDEIRMVDCSMATRREQIDVLTRDGVHFGFHMFLRFAAECDDAGVVKLLSTVAPEKEGLTISTQQLYETFVHPAIGEVVRRVVSPYRAVEIHERQEVILTNIRKRFLEAMREREGHAIVLYEVNLSHLDYPPELDHANVDRAVQAILRDKAIAERSRVEAEIETMTLRRQLVEKEADTSAARIDKVGAALRRNPEYVQYEPSRASRRSIGRRARKGTSCWRRRTR